ncbi:MAG: phosphodiester glycosidase family protein [Chthoniobacter sp.]
MMNGAIFEEGGVPSGLLVIEHKIIRPLNTADGKGNFFLKPNGVFYIDDAGAHILSTPEYASLKVIPRLAIQSGPLLLRGGRVHPSFNPASTNRLHRNGVGVRRDGRVIFAITEFGQKKQPSLYEFADFFRSQGCEDALFLDGDISQNAVGPGFDKTRELFRGDLCNRTQGWRLAAVAGRAAHFTSTGAPFLIFWGEHGERLKLELDGERPDAFAEAECSWSSVSVLPWRGASVKMET